VPSTGNLYLLHYSSGAWADVTTSDDRGTGTVCGQVSSLSPFVVASDSITDAPILVRFKHNVSISHKHRAAFWRKEAKRTIFGYYNVEFVAPDCHDAYDGALGQTYKCRYAIGGPEVFAWSNDQEEAFRVPDMFTPSGSYLAKALCDTLPAGVPSSGAAANHQHQRRGLASGGTKPESRAEPDASSKESRHAHPYWAVP